MEKLKKEAFEKWVEENKWLQLDEKATPTGRQVTFLTPSGHFIIAIYNLKGDLESIAQPVPVMPTPVPMGRSPLDFRGGSQFPPGPPR